MRPLRRKTLNKQLRIRHDVEGPKMRDLREHRTSDLIAFVQNKTKQIAGSENYIDIEINFLWKAKNSERPSNLEDEHDTGLSKRRISSAQGTRPPQKKGRWNRWRKYNHGTNSREKRFKKLNSNEKQTRSQTEKKSNHEKNHHERKQTIEFWILMFIKNILTILQYNVKKSRERIMISLFKNEKIKKYDVLTIQKPWRNSYASTTYNSNSNGFHLTYGISRSNAAPGVMPPLLNYPTSMIFLNISTMASSLEAALENLTLQDVPNFKRTARIYGTVESTLRRRYKRQTVSKQKTNSMYKQRLTDAQENSLIRQINVLTDREIPPTPSMIKNFAEEMLKDSMKKNWTNEFVRRYNDQLKNLYLKNFDKNRMQFEYLSIFKQFYNLIWLIHQLNS